MDTSKGIMYIATGQRFRDLASRSASSARRVMPDLPVCLVTDQEPPLGGIWNRVEVRPQLESDARRLSKVVYLTASPFERTLFLDADTHVCADVCDIFRLLDRFDVVGSHAPLRLQRFERSIDASIPAAFPMINGGVLGFRRTPEVLKFLETWAQHLREDPATGFLPDQGHMRAALYASRLQIGVLTPEFNCRTNYPVFLCGEARILHGRRKDLPVLAGLLNFTTEARVFPRWILRLPAPVIRLLAAVLRTKAAVHRAAFRRRTRASYPR